MPRRKKPQPAQPEGPKLTAKQRRFCEEYLVDLNATRAATRAGYSARTANEQGARLLAHASVSGVIKAGIEARSKRTEIDADWVLKRLALIASADPRELVRYRRVCCRYCHGEGHRYQETPAEHEQRKQAHAAAVAEARRRGKPAPAKFGALGGTGFDRTKPPHPDCPECQGEGEGEVVIADTSELSEAARTLLAGIKTTKDGIEVKMHDPVAALKLLGDHLKLWVQRHEHSGPNGGPIQQRTEHVHDLSDDDLARIASKGRS